MRFGKANVYENIVAELKGLMEMGALRHGEKLPSVRVYAVERKVNPNTVAKAYAALEADGYIRVLPKKGGYVCYGEARTEEREQELKGQLFAWKRLGVTREEIERTLAQVYKEDDDE